jgi:hypothetical protein
VAPATSRYHLCGALAGIELFPDLVMMMSAAEAFVVVENSFCWHLVLNHQDMEVFQPQFIALRQPTSIIMMTTRIFSRPQKRNERDACNSSDELCNHNKQNNC